jgi:hypothetical protein
MIKRDNKGRFIKGVSYSPKTQFKRGEHWRKRKPFWDKEWLLNEYQNKGLSAKDISIQFNVTENAILFWLNKHKIKTRTMSEIRKRKYWGVWGDKNGMFGRINSESPNWKGGITQERQSFYSSLEWKNIIHAVYDKYNYKCNRCGNNTKPMCIHHIVSFKYKDIRCNLNNLVLLCQDCHHFIHSKLNVNNEYLMSYEQFNIGQ